MLNNSDVDHSDRSGHYHCSIHTVHRSRIYDSQQKEWPSRWYILISPIGAILLGILWSLVFKGTSVEGAWGACESLGEGLMYITAWTYWKNQKNN